uniref:ENTH domain-containing protein n=1 Tax=Fagus sylvatica TaxID=28930 RepID=A0A2N9GR43_FAGSY
MDTLKKLRNLIDILKDKAPLIKATLSTKRHASSITVAVLHATTHNSPYPPSEKRVAAVLAFGHGSRLTACACIEVLMDRLHDTHSASVALKCLFTIHNVITRGSFILKDQLSFYPSSGGRNFLNLSTFRDNSNVEMWELSYWVRWYAGLLELSLMISRVLGYYFYSSSCKDNKDKADKVLSLFNSDLSREIDVLVDFTERICEAPDLHFQRNNLVYEVVRMVSEDYSLVQSEILVRVVELGNRMENMSYGELTQFLNPLKRLEDCKEKLLLLFVNREMNDGLWDLISQMKKKVLMVKGKREEVKLVMVRMGHRDESISESARFRKQFAESGQLFRFTSGSGEWLGLDRVSLPVSTVR